MYAKGGCRLHSVADVAVLQFSRGISHTLNNTSIFIYIIIYINIELILDYSRINFGTATLQQLQREKKYIFFAKDS